jgi:hypothetical protein
MYSESMTQRFTVTVPDEVATRLQRETNVSAYVTRAVRLEMRGEIVRAQLAEAGVAVTDDGLARARAQLAAAADSPAARDQRARLARRRARAGGAREHVA